MPTSRPQATPAAWSPQTPRCVPDRVVSGTDVDSRMRQLTVGDPGPCQHEYRPSSRSVPRWMSCSPPPGPGPDVGAGCMPKRAAGHAGRAGGRSDRVPGPRPSRPWRASARRSRTSSTPGSSAISAGSSRSTCSARAATFSAADGNRRAPGLIGAVGWCAPTVCDSAA